MSLITYKNDPKLKKRFIEEIEKHRKADAIEQGTYGHQNGEWRGCAVACSLRSLDIIDGKQLVERYDAHVDYETRLGIPEWLARLEDTLFENLPVDEAKKWPTAFAEAVPVGVNLDPVKWSFCAFLMKENIDRVLKLDIADVLKEQVVTAITAMLAVHENALMTGEWDESAARSAAWSAESAAWSAAWSAAESAARSAARSAAWSAESAARSAESAARSAASAAWSAAWSAESAARSAESAAQSAASAAWSAAFQQYAAELLRLIRKCQ